MLLVSGGRKRKRTFGFHAGGFVEELFGKDILSDEDDGAAKCAQYTEYIAGKLDGTSKNDAKSKGNEGEVRGCCVVDVENEAISEDSEEWGKAFDRVDQGDGDLFGGGRRENMSTDLEHGERECCSYHVAGRVSNSMFKGRYGSS